jgi:hypothetical protein
MPHSRFLFVLLVGAAAGALPIPASAQEPNPVVRERVIVSVGNERRDTPVRVQVGVNFFIPGPTGEGEEAAKLRDGARRMIYEMAANECQFLEQTLAKTCRLESINVNVNANRQQTPRQVDGLMLNANFALQITPK